MWDGRAMWTMCKMWMGRRRRMWMVMWFWMSFALFTVLTVRERSSRRFELSDLEIASLSDDVRTSRFCDPALLPSSLQLHCRMYRHDVITGSLCAPLCETGQLCDVISSLGNGHKEVMVTQCHHFCREGQRVKAVLKHDEFSASQSGYEAEYGLLNETRFHGNGSLQIEKLRALLSLHLPAQDVGEFLTSSLRAVGLHPTVAGNHTLPVAVYNSLLLLFRQKEYVLFEAYRHKGVFPTVYGTCGPLYLVEYCHPLLRSDTPSTQSGNSLALSSALLTESGDTKSVPEPHFENTLLWSPSQSTDNLPYSDMTKVSESYLDTYLNTGVAIDETRPSKKTSSSNSFTSFVLFKLYSLYSNWNETLSFKSAVSVDSDQLYEYVNTRDSSSEGRTQDIENLSLDGFNPVPNKQKKSLDLYSWKQRVNTALAILRYLQTLEHPTTFPQPPLLCDPKLEHFALSARDSRLKLIDADLLLFHADRYLGDEDNGMCTEHRDCSDVMCRGWCNKTTGRCVRVQTNNNLQASKNNVSPFVIFHQPLYLKILVIVSSEQADSHLKSIVNCLGIFHLQMSFLGAIGHLMAGFGLHEVLELVFAPKAAVAQLGICENVFLRPSLEFGPLFTDIPSTVHHDVTRLLCHCATDVTWMNNIPLQKPSAAVRDRLMEVLQRSLLLDTQNRVTNNPERKRETFLFDNC